MSGPPASPDNGGNGPRSVPIQVTQPASTPSIQNQGLAQLVDIHYESTVRVAMLNTTKDRARVCVRNHLDQLVDKQLWVSQVGLL
jgi:hypothetical protein